ncbi:MAG TPA: RNHCP domain-containing protein [Streptosporangiaceae bacterium]|nr:RNHCP domain-containing protein [Streptosporangiaceae bacterium]
MNRSLARAKPGCGRPGQAQFTAVRAERNPALGLKIPSSIRRQSHGQGCPESGFSCEYRCVVVTPLTSGSYRNHCPVCLWSKHLDVGPGDRLSGCGGRMRPERRAAHSGHASASTTNQITSSTVFVTPSEYSEQSRPMRAPDVRSAGRSRPFTRQAPRSG